jgi:type VII secretion protein EccB
VPSRQDQLHSYQYSVQRVVAALVSHDPDPHRSPLRRAGTTALVSLVIAAVAVGSVAIYGLLTGTGSKEINQDTVVYVEKGSGARFVYNSTEKLLHPVLNYSSALLIAAGPEPEVVSASHQQLATVPLGVPLGIPGAPDSMPAASGLLAGAWSVCSQPAAGSGSPQSTVVVGTALPDGTPAGTDGLLVVDTARKVYLVYANRRHFIPGGVEGLAGILPALDQNTATPWPVAGAFTNVIPLGADLAPPEIPGAGRPARDGRFPVGQVLYSALPGGATQWRVVLADSTAPVTELQAKLLTTVVGAPAPIQDSDYGKGTKPGVTISDVGRADALPSVVPKLRNDLSSLCLTAAMIGSPGPAGVVVNPTVPAGVAVTGPSVPNANTADLVSVPRGAGAVVVSSASPSAPAGSGTITLVTDTGLSYPVAGPAALAKLGYGAVDLSKVQVPAELVDLLHQGPALDPVQATKPGQ